MKYIRVIPAIVLMGLFAVGATVSAQPGMGKYQQLYTTGSVTTVSGVVQSVFLDTPPGVRIQAVYLSLKTDAESIPVQLGPESFVQKLTTKFDKGDKIEVTGAKLTVDGKTMILAAQVKKGAETVVLRNSSGVPVWSGQ
jgi:hypothetical protein